MTLHFSQFLNLVIILASSLLVSAAVCPLAIWVARKANLLDMPGAAAHKLHTRPTPLAGGIALVISAIIILGIFKIWGNPFIPLMGAVGIIIAFGLWDDARGISATKKLIGQVLAALVLIATGNYVRFLSGFTISFLNPGVITALNWIITILWLVGITNAFNLIDSMDGLVAGISILTFGFFVGLTLVSEQSDLARFCAAFLGISIGLFIFNISPAKLFLGDSGAQALGFVLAAVAFIYNPKDFPQGSSWFLPILLLGMPIFDTTLVPWQSTLIFGLVVAVGIGMLIFLENARIKVGGEHG
jgi:UDP-GlcNAc:undecaprenyl-phosphate GlcNAc-1-phosphate transferase